MLENSMRCIKYCKFPNNEYTHVQSSLWPQKNMVCLLWSPKPSCLRPGIYRHSGSWYFTQLSKSWYRKRKKARVFERMSDKFWGELTCNHLLARRRILWADQNHHVPLLPNTCTHYRPFLRITHNPEIQHQVQKISFHVGLIINPRKKMCSLDY